MTKLELQTAHLLSVVSNGERTEENKNEVVSLMIKGFAADALNLLVNINETSTNELDKAARITDLCKEYGLTFNRKKFY